MFGGTIDKANSELIEEYDVIEDKWKALKVRLTIPVSLFNSHFCYFSDEIVKFGSEMGNSFSKSLDKSREDHLADSLIEQGD